MPSTKGVFLWEFVGQAGERMHDNNNRRQTLKRSHARVVSCPEDADEPEFERRLTESDDAAISFHAGKDHMTDCEHGDEMQKAYLMALDFMDSIGPDMRLLNMCRACPNSQPWHADQGKQNCCGLA